MGFEAIAVVERMAWAWQRVGARLVLGVGLVRGLALGSVLGLQRALMESGRSPPLRH